MLHMALSHLTLYKIAVMVRPELASASPAGLAVAGRALGLALEFLGAAHPELHVGRLVPGLSR
jgi:hypothetical protein